MTTAAQPREASDKVVLWLRMYRQMVAIRQFEAQVNELYTRALMPGLAHLYIGEEAVAVGVCEALERTDYITSTHRGHGHCLAKGAVPDRMFAELLGKEAGYCKGKGGSMHIADQTTGNLGANAIVCGSAGIATGAAFSSQRLGNGRVAVCFFGEGALGQGDESRAAFQASGDLRLREQSLYGIHALFGNHGRRYSDARDRLRFGRC
jgi:TPP-dependent pyruvate/acetoin dehydrogenase alpha subunit